MSTGTPISSAAATKIGLRVQGNGSVDFSNADGDLKVKFGDGMVKTIVVDT